MNVQYSMKPEQMRELTGRLEAAVRGIEAELDQLEARVVVLRGAWTGDAADAYDRAHAEWATSIQRMRELLGRAATAQAGALDRHLQARNEVAALWA